MGGEGRYRRAGLSVDRHLRAMNRAGGLLVLLFVASCGEAAPTSSKCQWGEVVSEDNAGNVASSGLAGVWLTAPGFDDVTMTLKEDGTFTWDNRSLDSCDTGTWTADVTTITFAFAEESPFCAGETLTWEYQLEGDRLTSEAVAATCPGDLPVGGGWEFERQADS